MINPEEINKILSLARYAPSVHNTQPWHFKKTDDGVLVTLDKRRLLEHGDPVGRETWISIGACIETIVIAAAGVGIKADVDSFKNEGVLISLVKTMPPDQTLFPAITKRFSDRSVYLPRALSKEITDELAESWHSKNVRIVVTSDKEIVKTVAQLTAQGMTLALTNKNFREELSQLINRPLSRSKIGFSTKSLRVSPLLGYFEPWRVKSSRSISGQAKKEQRRILSASGLVLVFSKGDTPEYWIDSGRAYQRAGLTATHLGLRQATTAAVVEAADFHSDIEKLVGTKDRLQTIMRLGYSQARPVHSKRLPLEKLVT